MSKKDKSDELANMVDEFVKNGGEIEQIPPGISADYLRFHGHRTAKTRNHLYNLSEKSSESRKRAGFHRESIVLTRESS
tara:strand:- start:187 stop:423 length:237 start_codon:yes stop_codon:yes gene_type:complete